MLPHPTGYMEKKKRELKGGIWNSEHASGNMNSGKEREKRDYKIGE